MSAHQQYVGRLAPSPTGLLHVGHAATFWTAYQRAQERHGILLLRDEDLDPQRSKQEFVDAMLEDLAWLGIEWTAPMIVQSKRLILYREAFLRLLAEGLAYPCSCSRRELARMVAAPHEDTDDEPVYSGRCRPTTTAARTFSEGVNYRFRVPEGETVSFTDANMGAENYTAGSDFGDFLVWRKDNVPAYQLAVVVDDHAMRISEVVRGRDLLKSTARQLLLYGALGCSCPKFYHCDLVCDDRGIRLAKRHDALSIRKLRELGLTPEEIRIRALTTNVNR